MWQATLVSKGASCFIQTYNALSQALQSMVSQLSNESCDAIGCYVCDWALCHFSKMAFSPGVPEQGYQATKQPILPGDNGKSIVWNQSTHSFLNSASHPGGHYWDYYNDALPGMPYLKSGHCGSIDGRAPVDFIELGVADLQISRSDFITWQGTRIVALAMVTRVTCPITIMYIDGFMNIKPHTNIA